MQDSKSKIQKYQYASPNHSVSESMPVTYKVVRSIALKGNYSARYIPTVSVRDFQSVEKTWSPDKREGSEI
jgi:hypothetical protein